VSRLLPDRAHVALLPGRVSGVRVTPWPRRGLLARATLGVPAATSGPRWAAAVESLVSLLAALGATGAAVAVTLSNRFARYTVLPWSEALARPADWQVFAERRMEALFGAKTDDHLIQVASAPRQAARLACALERPLVEAIRARLDEAGHRLASLRPRFAADFELVRRRIGGSPAWFIDHEPGQLAIGFAAAGAWRSVRQRRVEDDWIPQLEPMLRREEQLAGLPAGDTRAFLAADAGVDLPQSLGAIAVEPVYRSTHDALRA